jgi:hypothetical protein
VALPEVRLVALPEVRLVALPEVRLVALPEVRLVALPEVRLDLNTLVILVQHLETTSTRPPHHVFSQKKNQLARETSYLLIYLDRYQSFGAKEYV